jgi:hypothetical protein
VVKWKGSGTRSKKAERVCSCDLWNDVPARRGRPKTPAGVRKEESYHSLESSEKHNPDLGLLGSVPGLCLGFAQPRLERRTLLLTLQQGRLVCQALLSSPTLLPSPHTRPALCSISGSRVDLSVCGTKLAGTRVCLLQLSEEKKRRNVAVCVILENPSEKDVPAKGVRSSTGMCKHHSSNILSFQKEESSTTSKQGETRPCKVFSLLCQSLVVPHKS